MDDPLEGQFFQYFPSGPMFALTDPGFKSTQFFSFSFDDRVPSVDFDFESLYLGQDEFEGPQFKAWHMELDEHELGYYQKLTSLTQFFTILLPKILIRNIFHWNLSWIFANNVITYEKL